MLHSSSPDAAPTWFRSLEPACPLINKINLTGSAGGAVSQLFTLGELGRHQIRFPILRPTENEALTAGPSG